MRKNLRQWRGAVAIAATAAALTTVIPTADAAPPSVPPAGSDRVGAEVVSDLADHGEVDVVVMLDGHRPGSDVARLRRSAEKAQQAVLAGFGDDALVGVRRFETVPAFTATVRSAEALERLSRRPGVRRIDVDLEGVQGTLAQTVPFVGADTLHDMGLTGEGATVAVFDSGVEKTHPDLAGSVVHEACFAPWRNRICPGTSGWFQDQVVVGDGAASDAWGHGTAATGIIASRGNVASEGVAPEADIVALKVYENCPTPADCAYAMSSVLAGLDHLAANPQLGVDVINMSLGIGIPYTGPHCDDADAVLMAGAATVGNLRAAGILTVVAAGNDYHHDRLSAPACLSNVLSVGASTPADTVQDYSNTAPTLDVVAPLWSTHPWINGTTTSMGGTSAAAPMVAGCAALLSQMDAAPGPDEITQAITSTGVPVTRGAATFPRLDCAAAAAAVDGDPDPGDGGGDDDEAVCVTAANTAHVSANRATAVFGYAFARGTADSLGRNRSTVTTSLREAGPDRWELVGSC